MPLSKILPASIQQPNPINIVINGAMNVAQRGVTATNPGGGYHTVDRWRMSQNSSGLGNYVMSQVADAPGGTGLTNSLKLEKDGVTSTGSGNSAYIHYNAEGLDVQHLDYGASNAKSLTVSFWVKSSVTGTFGLSLGDGQAGRGNVQQYTISASDTWEYKAVTFVGDTAAAIDNDSSAGLSIHWALGVGSNYQESSLNTWTATHKLGTSSQTNWVGTDDATFYLTGVCANSGDKAIEFPHESYAETLAKCQRYFQQLHYRANVVIRGGYGHTGEYWTVNLATPMRATPTSSDNSGSGSISYSNCDSFSLTANANYGRETPTVAAYVHPNDSSYFYFYPATGGADYVKDFSAEL